MEKEIVCKKNFEKEILQSSSCGFKFVRLEEKYEKKMFSFTKHQKEEYLWIVLIKRESLLWRHLMIQTSMESEVKILPLVCFFIILLVDLKVKYSMLRRIADGSFGVVYQMQNKEISLE